MKRLFTLLTLLTLASMILAACGATAGGGGGGGGVRAGRLAADAHTRLCQEGLADDEAGGMVEEDAASDRNGRVDVRLEDG